MGGASKQMQAKKLKKEKEATEAAKKAEEEVHIVFIVISLSGILLFGIFLKAY